MLRKYNFYYLRYLFNDSRLKGFHQISCGEEQKAVAFHVDAWLVLKYLQKHLLSKIEIGSTALYINTKWLPNQSSNETDPKLPSYNYFADKVTS